MYVENEQLRPFSSKRMHGGNTQLSTTLGRHYTITKRLINMIIILIRNPI